MADESTSTTGSDVTDDTGSATDTGVQGDVTAQLGEAGKKALAEERKARAAAEKAAKVTQKQLDDTARRLQEFEDRDKTEAQKLADRLAEAEKTAASAQGQLLRYQVAADKNLPPTLAARLQGSTQEELEADAEVLLKEFGSQQQRATPNFDGGVRKPADQPTDMNALIRQRAGLG